LNKDSKAKNTKLDFSGLDLNGKYAIKDLWAHKVIGVASEWKGKVEGHETKLLSLSSGRVIL
jgi:alpha-galactosidase